MIQPAFYGTAFTDCEMKESKKGSEYATLLALTSNGADEQPVPQASESRKYAIRRQSTCRLRGRR